MGGIDLRGDQLIIERPPNYLDELATAFTEMLDELDIKHVYVSGYVAVLTGRLRATEAIDVLLERLDSAKVERLAAELDRVGCWEPAMPLDRMEELL